MSPNLELTAPPGGGPPRECVASGSTASQTGPLPAAGGPTNRAGAPGHCHEPVKRPVGSPGVTGHRPPPCPPLHR